jgi:hypothetical protein
VSLSLRINLIVAGVITVLVASMIALQLASLRSAVREEIVAANRVTTQLLNRVGGSTPRAARSGWCASSSNSGACAPTTSP